MVRHKKRILGFGLAAAGFFIIVLLVAGVAMGGDGGLADDRIADLSGSGIEGGSGDALAASSVSYINYQGRLTDSAGNPLNGTYGIHFALYDDEHTTSSLENIAAPVTCTNGLFNIALPFDASYFDGRALWLGIQVGSDPEMTPRQELHPVPYALSLRPGAIISSSLVDEPILRARNLAAYNGDAIYAETSGDNSEGFYADTYGDYSEGFYADTSGDVSHGVHVRTGGDWSNGVKSYTSGAASLGVYAETMGPNSYAVYGYSAQDVGIYGEGKEAGGYFTTTAGGSTEERKAGVNISTQYDYNPGVQIKTAGVLSEGVHARTTGNNSPCIWASTSGCCSTGVVAHTWGNWSDGVWVRTEGENSPAVYSYSAKDVGIYGEGKEAGGYFTTTAGGTSINLIPGVNISTQYDYNPGVRIKTSGYGSEGVYAFTSRDDSEGVSAHTLGYGSEGVQAETYGDNSQGVSAHTLGYGSEGVSASSAYSYAITANTLRGDHNYAFYTSDDNIYVGGKSNLVGAVDPIIVEGFNADLTVDYELGDVVCLAESGAVKPCSKAHDTRVVGVIGPTVELADGEIMVVIMGHQGAKPDEEHVQVLEQRLERAEAQQLTTTEKLEEPERLDSEIAMLRSQLDEAKSVTRQVVRVKADASYGAINAGDLLTTSPTEGHAMKAQPVDLGGVEIYRPGTIIGKAMEPLNSGTGLIEVFVTLQ